LVAEGESIYRYMYWYGNRDLEHYCSSWLAIEFVSSLTGATLTQVEVHL